VTPRRKRRAPSNPPAEHPPTHVRKKKPRLLLVVADDESRAAYAETMGVGGWTVEDVTDWREAVSVAAAFAPDFIVVDLGHVSGANPGEAIGATQQLRRDPRTRETPIVALTASPKVREEASDAGCAVCLTKPCEPRALLAALTELRDRRAPAKQSKK
jgi:CheY-like chemotaxis protein